MHQCKDCGIQLLPETAICPQCGKMQSSNPGSFSRLPQRESETALPINTENSWRETVSVGIPASPLPRQSPVQQYNSAAIPSIYGPAASLPQPLAGYTNTPPSIALQFPTGSKPPKRLSIAIMVATFILTLLLVASGTGLIFYTTVTRPAQLQAQATATVRSILTSDTHLAATVQVQTSATAQAQTNQQATAQAQATAQIQSTVTAQQDIYNKATDHTPAVSSSLAAQTTSNWEIYDAQEGGGCTFTDGALHSSITNKGYYIPCFAQNSHFTNFALEVQIKTIKGDNAGIIFRADDQTNKFYMFRITHDSYYSLDLRTANDHGTPLAYDKSPFIKMDPGQSTTLTIIAQDSNLYMYINKQFVGSASDSTYTTGKIGLFASASTNPTDIAFSNLRIWTL